MLQRIADLIDYGSIQLCLFTGHVKFHWLVEFTAQITDHTRELVDNALDWNHSHFHD